jgi:DNA-repair protein complementing XP-A cells
MICEKCQLPDSQHDLDDQMCQVFGVLVCKTCKVTYPEDYRLLPKTTVKSEFLLTDEELADETLLPHLEKPNPKSSRWKNMQLYLRKQVVTFAISKWGSLDALQEAKLDRKATTTKAKVRKYEQKVSELRRRTRLENWQAKRARKQMAKVHRHTFIVNEHIKTCKECGFEVRFETIE